MKLTREEWLDLLINGNLTRIRAMERTDEFIKNVYSAYTKGRPPLDFAIAGQVLTIDLKTANPAGFGGTAGGVLHGDADFDFAVPGVFFGFVIASTKLAQDNGFVALPNQPAGQTPTTLVVQSATGSNVKGTASLVNGVFTFTFDVGFPVNPAVIADFKLVIVSGASTANAATDPVARGGVRDLENKAVVGVGGNGVRTLGSIAGVDATGNASPENTLATLEAVDTVGNNLQQLTDILTGAPGAPVPPVGGVFTRLDNIDALLGTNTPGGAPGAVMPLPDQVDNLQATLAINDDGTLNGAIQSKFAHVDLENLQIPTGTSGSANGKIPELVAGTGGNLKFTYVDKGTLGIDTKTITGQGQWAASRDAAGTITYEKIDLSTKADIDRKVIAAVGQPLVNLQTMTGASAATTLVAQSYVTAIDTARGTTTTTAITNAIAQEVTDRNAAITTATTAGTTGITTHNNDANAHPAIRQLITNEQAFSQGIANDLSTHEALIYTDNPAPHGLGLLLADVQSNEQAINDLVSLVGDITPAGQPGGTTGTDIATWIEETRIIADQLRRELDTNLADDLVQQTDIDRLKALGTIVGLGNDTTQALDAVILKMQRSSVRIAPNDFVMAPNATGGFDVFSLNPATAWPAGLDANNDGYITYIELTNYAAANPAAGSANAILSGLFGRTGSLPNIINISDFIKVGGKNAAIAQPAGTIGGGQILTRDSTGAIVADTAVLTDFALKTDVATLTSDKANADFSNLDFSVINVFKTNAVQPLLDIRAYNNGAFGNDKFLVADNTGKLHLSGLRHSDINGFINGVRLIGSGATTGTANFQATLGNAGLTADQKTIVMKDYLTTELAKHATDAELAAEVARIDALRNVAVIGIGGGALRKVSDLVLPTGTAVSPSTTLITQNELSRVLGTPVPALVPAGAGATPNNAVLTNVGGTATWAAVQALPAFAAANANQVLRMNAAGTAAGWDALNDKMNTDQSNATWATNTQYVSAKLGTDVPITDNTAHILVGTTTGNLRRSAISPQTINLASQLRTQLWTTNGNTTTGAGATRTLGTTANATTRTDLNTLTDKVYVDSRTLTMPPNADTPNAGNTANYVLVQTNNGGVITRQYVLAEADTTQLDILRQQLGLPAIP